MSTQMVIRLESDIKDKFVELAKMEGKTASQVIRELMENYIKERDIKAYIDDLWKRTGDKLTAKGIGQIEIEKAIKDARKKHESRH